MLRPQLALPSDDAPDLSGRKRADVLGEYLGYIRRLAGRRAGKLSPSQGESVATVRRRLGAAARAAGAAIVIGRAGDAVYFWWAQGSGATRRADRNRAEVLGEYLGYIQRVAGRQAGRLSPSQGESVSAVKRRLGAAARAAGVAIVTRRSRDAVYFWAAPRGSGRRPGRGVGG